MTTEAKPKIVYKQHPWTWDYETGGWVKTKPGKKPEPSYKPSEYWAWNYDKGEFMRTTEAGVELRTKMYEQFPGIAPPGTPGKQTPAQYKERITQMIGQQKIEEEKRLLDLEGITQAINQLYPVKAYKPLMPDLPTEPSP